MSVVKVLMCQVTWLYFGDDKPYKFDVCGKGCSQSGDLQIHERIHPYKKPYTCYVCGKPVLWFTKIQLYTFFPNSNTCKLQQHIYRRIHAGDKPYSCDALVLKKRI